MDPSSPPPPPTITLTPHATKTLTTTTLHDRIHGVLTGAATGDAIGLYTEFLSRTTSCSSYPNKTITLCGPTPTQFRRDHHRSPHRPGNWTDDTDHALLIVLSFLHSNGTCLDEKDFAERLNVWVRMGLRALDTLPLGLGRTVGSIVRSTDFLQDPELKAYEVWVKGKRNVAPNGSLMRTHPLGVLCLAKTREETTEVAARFSCVTHVDPRCVVSCIIGTELVRGLVLGEYTSEEHIDQVIDVSVQWYISWSTSRNKQRNRSDEPELDVKELNRHVNADNLSDLQLDDSQKMGYVYKCLGAGIHLLRLSLRLLSSSKTPLATQLTLFETLITDLIFQGGDADTNACFAGALLGALLGYRNLPPHWRDGLRHGEWLLAKSEAVCSLLGVSEVKYDGKTDPDTAVDGGRGLLSEDQMERRWMELQARIAQEESERNRLEKEGEKKKQSGIFGKLKDSLK